jgi:hypothetical protein
MLSKFEKIIKKIPCPFVVSGAMSEEDEDKVKVLQDILIWDWNNGGRERFFKNYKDLYVNDVITNFKAEERIVKYDKKS